MRPEILALVFLCGLSTAQAVEPREMLGDPVLEARARTIDRQLRCMVCQGESVDTSDASLAHDMRVVIRQRIRAGDTDAQIVGYLRSRYGDFILLQPPLEPKTLVLWSAPVAALAVGCGLAAFSFRKPGRSRRAT